MADKSSSKGSNGTFYHIKGKESSTYISLIINSDFVYIESSPSQPYRIAQIAGFKPGPNSTVVVRCRFYDRPRDVEPHWLRKLNAVSEKFMYTNDFHIKNFSSDMSQTEKKRRIHQFKLRELIGNTNGNSESDEAYINASYIRGKCRIYRYIDVETIDDYIQHEDTFFYLASFEDEPKHLALEGEDTISKIARYSKCVNVGDFVAKPKPAAENEDIIWDGVNGGVSDHEFDSFLSIVRAVGLSARALDMGRRVGDSSLQTSLAYSFRDSTQYMAYFLLHTSNYDSNMAVSKLLVDGSPVMCSDQLEMWSSGNSYFKFIQIC
ncbi:Metastasis-associated protein MTA3 [Thelohanellus kitauei]|uniref:Metastasis-associated protein MTA3 n=1 Tax=Thelohanellus kitauei TaxID=669202 RepID=A0A0C2M1M6_THEKT|nr:Metastasis-associated protein MTA3 [Thelohanellus kitauei]